VLRYLKASSTRAARVLADSLDSPTAPLGASWSLTFDDGLRNNLEVAYPVLQAAGAARDLLRLPRADRTGAVAVESRGAPENADLPGAPAQVETVIDK